MVHPPSSEAIHALIVRARVQKRKRSKSKHVQLRRELGKYRDIAMLEALRSSGMRVGELVSMNRNDLNPEEHSARVIGKGRKERTVYLDERAWRAIRKYLILRADDGSPFDMPVFAHHDLKSAGGNRLSTRTVERIFNRLASDMQAQVRLTPHSLRLAFATQALEATGNRAAVQDLLGHASPLTTRIYAKVSNKQLREAHRKTFGR